MKLDLPHRRRRVTRMELDKEHEHVDLMMEIPEQEGKVAAEGNSELVFGGLPQPIDSH